MDLLIRTGCRLRRGFRMENIRFMISLGAIAVITKTSIPIFAGQQDGVGLAIVYDTSGSMKEQVRDRAGRSSPKYVIANRALEAISKRIQMFSTHPTTGGPR